MILSLLFEVIPVQISLNRNLYDSLPSSLALLVFNLSIAFSACSKLNPSSITAFSLPSFSHSAIKVRSSAHRPETQPKHPDNALRTNSYKGVLPTIANTASTFMNS